MASKGAAIRCAAIFAYPPFLSSLGLFVKTALRDLGAIPPALTTDLASARAHEVLHSLDGLADARRNPYNRALFISALIATYNEALHRAKENDVIYGTHIVTNADSTGKYQPVEVPEVVKVALQNPPENRTHSNILVINEEGRPRLTRQTIPSIDRLAIKAAEEAEKHVAPEQKYAAAAALFVVGMARHISPRPYENSLLDDEAIRFSLCTDLAKFAYSGRSAQGNSSIYAKEGRCSFPEGATVDETISSTLDPPEGNAAARHTPRSEPDLHGHTQGDNTVPGPIEPPDTVPVPAPSKRHYKLSPAAGEATKHPIPVRRTSRSTSRSVSSPPASGAPNDTRRLSEEASPSFESEPSIVLGTEPVPEPISPEVVEFPGDAASLEISPVTPEAAPTESGESACPGPSESPPFSPGTPPAVAPVTTLLGTSSLDDEAFFDPTLPFAPERSRRR